MTRKSIIQTSMQTGMKAQPGAEAFVQPETDAALGESTETAETNDTEKSAPARAFWVEQLQAADLEAVRILSRTTHWPIGRLGAIGLSKLGNGWVYFLLAALIFGHWGRSGFKVVIYAAVNAAVTHSLYPLIKRRYRRRRPFKVDPELASLLATLDEHSFPSGHTMTLSAVLTPIVILWPALALSAALMVLCLAWSRVATAHHYPSDVLAGAALGIGLGYPISLALMAI